MCQPTPDILAYATPVRPPAAKCIRVISVAGICVGSITLLFRASALVAIVVWLFNRGERWLNRNHQIYGLIVAPTFAALAVSLLVASIGFRSRKEWARIWLVRHSVFYLGAVAIDMIAASAIFLRLVCGSQNDLSASDRSVAILIMVTMVVSTMLGSVLPICILVLLRKP